MAAEKETSIGSWKPNEQRFDFSFVWIRHGSFASKMDLSAEACQNSCQVQTSDDFVLEP